MAKQDRGLPLHIVVPIVLGIVTFMCWGVLAASYAEGTDAAPQASAGADSRNSGAPTRRRMRGFAVWFAADGVATFVSNSFRYLPQLPTVFIWHFSNRPWLPIVLGVVEAGVIGGGLVMKGAEKRFHQGPKVKKRQIALPQMPDEF